MNDIFVYMEIYQDILIENTNINYRESYSYYKTALI